MGKYTIPSDDRTVNMAQNQALSYLIRNVGVEFLDILDGLPK